MQYGALVRFTGKDLGSIDLDAILGRVISMYMRKTTTLTGNSGWKVDHGREYFITIETEFGTDGSVTLQALKCFLKDRLSEGGYSSPEEPITVQCFLEA